MPTRGTIRAFALDLAGVMALVVIGTRNHDTDTGPGAVLAVAAPFLIALSAAWAAPQVRRAPTSMPAGATVWVATVAVGMMLRSFAFDRGTAPAFVVVASVFLGATMLGWRTVATWRSG